MSAVAERRTLCIRMVAGDGTIERVALTYPQDLHMSNAEIYKGGLFTESTTQSNELSGGPATIDFGWVDDADVATRAEIESGKWDDAKIYYFATDWSAPVEDEEPIALFTLGKVEDIDGRFKAELMGLRDKLTQGVGRVHSPSCQWIFADKHLDTGVIASDLSKCKLDPAAFTVTGTLTGVTDGLTFQDTARVEVADYFGNGEIIFTSGENAGLSRRTVKAYLVDGTITVNAPFYFLPQIGDTYEMIAGCRKRGVEDCKTKYSNRKRFGGFSYVPTNSQVTKIGSQ